MFREGTRSGGGGGTDEPTVAVVEDDAALAALYAEWLADGYDVLTASDGEAAVERFDDGVDVALLDRRMPGPSVDEVVDALRDRRIDCRIGLVTAVEPDLGVVDVPFDDYLFKPVTRRELRTAVDRMRSLAAAADTDRQLELASKRVRRRVLASEVDGHVLADSDAFVALDAEVERLEAELADAEGTVPVGEPVFERTT